MASLTVMAAVLKRLSVSPRMPSPPVCSTCGGAASWCPIALHSAVVVLVQASQKSLAYLMWGAVTSTYSASARYILLTISPRRSTETLSLFEITAIVPMK